MNVPFLCCEFCNIWSCHFEWCLQAEKGMPSAGAKSNDDSRDQKRKHKKHKDKDKKDKDHKKHKHRHKDKSDDKDKNRDGHLALKQQDKVSITSLFLSYYECNGLNQYFIHFG